MSVDDTRSRDRTPTPSPTKATPRAVRPGLLWFAVLGGPAAWLVHLVVAWGVLELSCISPAEGPWVDNRGGSPGFTAWASVVAGTAGPWLVTVAALLSCLVVHRRHRRLVEAGAVDALAAERIPFLLVLGTLLDLFALAAITGGVVAMVTLKACG